MKNMMLDVDAAFEVWRGLKSKEAPESNPKMIDFLREIPMSPQTYHNLQNAKGKQKPFQYAQRMKDITGMSMDELIKPQK